MQELARLAGELGSMRADSGPGDIASGPGGEKEAPKAAEPDDSLWTYTAEPIPLLPANSGVPLLRLVDMVGLKLAAPAGARAEPEPARAPVDDDAKEAAINKLQRLLYTSLDVS